MTDLQTRTTLSRRTDIPEWLVVQEMDRAKRVAEDTLRIHDTLAREIGYERVRIEQTQPGNVIAGSKGYSWNEIAIGPKDAVDPSGFVHFVYVAYADGTADQFDAGQFVSRQLPLDSEEPF